MECPVGVSRGVLSLAVDGISAGWQVRMRYGRGAGKHSIALAFFGHERGPNEARAVYTRSVRDGASWVCGTVWMFGPELAPFGLAVVSEFREWLEAGGMVDVGWYAGVRARSAERALDAKVVPCKSGCIEIAPHTHRASGRVVASKAKTGAKKESGG